MKLVLILMVKNESAIIDRCLTAVESLVDAFCVHDTGSTDDTCDRVHAFLKTHTGCLTQSTWKDFGHNRTLSFQAAREYLASQGWDLTTTYGLLLDADMVFRPGTLRQQPLTEIGYTIIQRMGTLEYPNCRLVRMDHPWTCRGVTHEYWDGPTTPLPKSVCWIDDRGDGGCKADKFERDARLLEQGLRDEPTNGRYMFYLAQTYNSLGRQKDAIQLYKQRIATGGWVEELWYSHYMIGQCYRILGDIPKFEAWMLRAHAYRPQRAESLAKLTTYFREVGQHYKAYHYARLGTGVSMPPDSLFLESAVYDYVFPYERSILEYYVHSAQPELGVRASMEVFLKTGEFQQNILSNLAFYVKPIGTATPMTLPSPFGPTFRPSAISVRTYPFANVRYVNYWMENGDYKTPPDECVQTENAYVNLDTGDVIAKMQDASISLPRRETHVKGLEDVRLYGSNRFTATVQEYTPGVSVLDGIYDVSNGTYTDCKILPSPNGQLCEKNWLPIGDTGSMIYGWAPFQVIGNASVTVSVPPFFQLLRGSAPPFQRNGEWWTLVHFVDYTKPRRYYHCFVILSSDFVPRRVSLPFVFQSVGVEYCICIQDVGDAVECYTSSNDSNPTRVRIPNSALSWLSIEVSRDGPK